MTARAGREGHTHDWIPVVFGSLMIADKRYVIVEIVCGTTFCEVKQWQVIPEEVW